MEADVRLINSKPLYLTLGAVALTFTVIGLMGLYSWWYVLVAIPLFLLGLAAAWFFPTIFLGVMLATLPLSLNMPIAGNAKLSVPGELLAVVAAITFSLRWIQGDYRSHPFLQHPLSKLIALYAIWLVVTALFSSMPLISLKFVVLQLVYFLAFYFFIGINNSKASDWRNLLYFFTAPVLALIVYSTLRHSQFGFVPQVSGFAPEPFFNDHTIYGALLALLFPFWVGHLLWKNRHGFLPKIVALLPLALLVVGMFLSYSRAVWVSLLMMLVLSLWVALRIRVRYLILLGALIAAAVIIYRQPLSARLMEVKSERGAGVKEHAASAVNISSSVSNLERLNRWEAAIDMFLQKPVLGFGPRTYQFQYGIFQNPELMTRLSTYFGDKGGAHSEYLKPLSETGLPGFMLFISILGFAFFRGFRLAYRAGNPQVRLAAATMVIALAGYWVHGLFNHFLGTDKIALLHWSFIAAIAVLDSQAFKKIKLPDGQ